MSVKYRATLAAVLAALAIGALGAEGALAQFGPPSTVFGSINDAAGPVPEGLKVEAYIGEVECSDGHGQTQFTGVGSSRVTVYAVDVVSREQRPGCGFDGADVRIKVGDRFAPQSTKWSGRGFVHFDITFGNVTPVPIPTFTPGPPPTTAPTLPVAALQETATAAASVTAAASETTGPGTPTATVRGGVTSSTPAGASGSGSDDGGDGFPVWAVVLLGLGGLAAIGGGVGYIISRNQARAATGEDDFLAPPPAGQA
jgi:hypothetical protein